MTAVNSSENLAQSREAVSAPAARRALGWKLALLLLVALGVRLALVPVRLNRPDRRDYIGSAQKIVRFGLPSFYDPTEGDRANREAPVPYPPIPVYFYAVAGYVYQMFDPSFVEIRRWRDVPVDSLALNYLIEIPIFVFDLLLAALLFWFVRRRHGDRQAWLCAGLYAFNPAVLLDGAMWAQPDAIHCFFLALAVVFLLERRPALCLPALALTLLAKPQPAVMVPVILLIALLNATTRQRLQSMLAATAATVIVLLPFLLTNPHAIVNMIRIATHAHPFVSLNAHNLWWLVTTLQGLNPRWLSDHAPLFYGLSYFAAGLLIFAGFYVVVVVKTLRTPLARLTAEPFAYIALLFFIFAVRMHENHLAQALPLLLLTGLTLRHQKVVFALLTLAVFANLLLHTHEITADATSPLLQSLRMTNAALHLATLVYWSRHALKGGITELRGAIRVGVSLYRGERGDPSLAKPSG